MTESPIQPADGTDQGKPVPRLLRWAILFLGVGGLVVAFQWSHLKSAWLIYRAHGLIQNADFSAAEPLLQQACQSSPEDVDARLLLASVQRQQAKLTEASATIEKIKFVPGQPKRLRHERLLLAARSGQISVAEPWLPELLANDNLDARDVCEAFVVGYRANLNPLAAFVLLDAWESDWPADYRPHAQRGLLAMTMTDWKTATDQFQKAVFKGDQRAGTHQRLGEAWLELNDAEQAHRAFKLAVKNDPDSAAAWRGLARACEQLGKEPESHDAWQTAAQLEPGSYETTFGLARMMLKQGDASAAAEKLAGLLESWPEDSRTLFHYAQALNELGETEQAQAVNIRWKAADENVQLIEELTKTLKANPTDFKLREQIGGLLMKHYSRSMGHQYLKSVLMGSSGTVETHRLLARFYEMQQQTKLAEFHLARSREISNNPAPTSN